MSSVNTLEENAARTLKRTPCRFRNPKFGDFYGVHHSKNTT